LLSDPQLMVALKNRASPKSDSEGNS